MIFPRTHSECGRRGPDPDQTGPILSETRLRWGLTIVMIQLLAFPASLYAASFYGTGFLPGQPSDAHVSGMSPSGEFLLGRAREGVGDAAVFYGERTLSLTTGAYEIAGGAVYSESVDRVRSASGLIDSIVGHSDGPTARQVWFETVDGPTGNSISNVVVPSYPDSSYDNEARGVGRNQRILIQTSNRSGASNAVFYTPAIGKHTDLGWLRANAIDRAGTRIVGIDRSTLTGNNEAALLDDTYGTRFLGVLEGGVNSEAFGISANGRNIVGHSDFEIAGSSGVQAFRWHADLGMRPLSPILDGGLDSTALDVDDSGNAVVGSYAVAGGSTLAFLWTPGTGRVDLANYLTNTLGLGSALSGWTLLEATDISADGRIIAGNGLDPNGRNQGFLIDLDGPQRATVILRPDEPDNSPSTWELWVECGDFTIQELYFGLVMPQSFNPGDPFDFARCLDGTITPGHLHCTAPSFIGPTVSPNSSISIPYALPLTQPDQREDTIYFRLIGKGGPLNNRICSPGDGETFLGAFELPRRDPELVRSALDGSHGRIDDTNLIRDTEVDFLREGLTPRTVVRLQPSLDDVNGTRFDVILDSEVSYGCFSFGIIMPPNANLPTFGDCTVDEPGSNFERSCVVNPDLGPNLNATAVRTLGPSENFIGSPLRPDTLYVYLEGQLNSGGALPAINLPDRPTRLGVFEFVDVPGQGFAHWPALSAEGLPDFDVIWNDVSDWCDTDENDVMTNSTSVQFYVVGLPGDDSDNDGLEDSWDPCPFVPSSPLLDDSGTLAQSTIPPVFFDIPDGIGNECQCGDVTGSGYIQSSNLDELRAGLLDPGIAGTFNQTLTCNSVGPIDYEVDPATGLPRDCEVNDYYVLLKAHFGTGPLIQAPGSPVGCPDIVAPPP